MAQYVPVVDVAQLQGLLRLLHAEGYRLVELTDAGLKVANVANVAPPAPEPAKKDDKQPPRTFGGRPVEEIGWALGHAPTTKAG